MKTETNQEFELKLTRKVLDEIFELTSRTLKYENDENYYEDSRDIIFNIQDMVFKLKQTIRLLDSLSKCK